MPRNTTCTIIVGTQRTGKTTVAKKIADKYQRKVLVIQPDEMEPVWNTFTPVSLDAIGRQRVSKCRIAFDVDDKEFFPSIMERFRGGLMVFDDAKVYFNNWSKMQGFEKYLIRRRQLDIDFLFIYHGYSAVPSLLWTYATHLILFRTIDSYQRSGDNIANFKLQEQRKIKVDQLAVTDPHAHKMFELI